MAREGTVQFADGRTAAYAEFGDPAGAPVLNCHSAPSSRRERYGEGALYARLGVRPMGGPAGDGCLGPGVRTARRGLAVRRGAADRDALGVGKVGVLSLFRRSAVALTLAHARFERVRRVVLVWANPPLDVPWRWPRSRRRPRRRAAAGHPRDARLAPDAHRVPVALRRR